MLRSHVALAGMLAGAGCAAQAPRPVLVSTGEVSQFVKTGRYDEVLRLCRDFARAYPGVRCEELGRTGEDRPIVALVIHRAGHAGQRPVIYVQAGIHAGEIEGKDAGLWFLRDLLDGKVV